MMIQIDDRHRLRTKDAMNMELFELRERRDGTPCWKSMGRYYQSLASALKAVYDMRVIASDFEGDLKAAMAEARAIECELLAAREVREWMERMTDDTRD